MNLSEFVKKFNLTVLTEPNFKDRPVTGCYIGDLLSRVMGKAQSGDVWITIMNNVNIVAVASLTDTACIVLCECVTVDADVIRKADGEGIVILQSEKTAYELASLFGGENGI